MSVDELNRDSDEVNRSTLVQGVLNGPRCQAKCWLPLETKSKVELQSTVQGKA